MTIVTGAYGTPVDIEVFYREVTPFVPGCPELVIRNAIRNACIRFCTDTQLITESITPGDSTVGVDVYTITPQAERIIVAIKELFYDENEIYPRTESELDREDPGWRYANNGTPTRYIQLEPGLIQFNRKPDVVVTGGIDPQTVATAPTRDAENVDERLFNEWSDAIKYGALTSLFEIPDKPWSDMIKSLDYGQKFNFQIQRGKARERMGYQNKSTVAQMRPWV